jgi:hypothetical protein
MMMSCEYGILLLLQDFVLPEWNDYSMVAAKQTMSVMRRLLTNGSLGQSTHLTASKLFQESC